MDQCYDSLCALFLAWLARLKNLGVVEVAVWDNKSLPGKQCTKRAAWKMFTKPSTNLKAISNTLATAIVVILSVYKFVM
jgi:uncharacterized protein